ncbi:pilus assembly PilX family protein [Rhodoferax sediminis]|uniref:Pilus assembly protein n=1 Tax=Rhodoferax sediminis TaxID=2509614 RepID=A0A515DEV0_9BURK|nr:pilus assembly PilX N-terminal domain-containing protein [Rhodoferax sediminis]QDL38917.1 pilus assembly protein [Rhodoferax sediminis]
MKKNPFHPRSMRAQVGATLLIAMIFLVLLTLIVISAIKATNVNTKVVGNMQIQKESEAAAQQAIEAVISTDFTQLTAPPIVPPIDINDSGQAASTYTVTVPKPTCTSVKPIKITELDPANTADQYCYASGAAQNTGIVGAGTGGNSLCSNSNWDISATATAPSVATTSTTTHQGVAVRVVVGANC